MLKYLLFRNGRGWSQPNNVGGGERSRKLPQTPANSLNAMGVLQSMLGNTQTPAIQNH